jgi:hypothetical protein
MNGRRIVTLATALVFAAIVLSSAAQPGGPRRDKGSPPAGNPRQQPAALQQAEATDLIREGRLMESGATTEAQQLLSGGGHSGYQAMERSVIPAAEAAVPQVFITSAGERFVVVGERAAQDGAQGILLTVYRIWQSDGHITKCNSVFHRLSASLAGPIITAPPAPKRDWGPEQATGEPDTPEAGDHQTAWASLTRDGQDEWLMLEYAEPVVPTEVRVHETYNPGALNKVSVFTEEGREVVLWTGEDPTPVGNDKGVSKTALRPGALRFRTKRVKLYLASRAVPGWNEIDAVALVGRTADRSERVQWAAAATASSTYAENAAGEPGGQLGGPTVEQRAEGTVPSRVGAAAPAEPRVWETRSCKICKSVQKIEAVAPDILFGTDLVRIVGKDWVWTYRGEGCETCAHQWQRGVRRSVGPIRDGTVVLVRKGQVYGAFMIERQRQRPEEASYVWAYGADGRRPLDAADPEATRSSSPATTVDRHGERRVEFGPFSVEWSAGPSSSGWGWLYYPRAPGDPLTEDDVAICVTDAESFHGIRPADSRWVYRRSPVEPAPDAPPTDGLTGTVPF